MGTRNSIRERHGDVLQHVHVGLNHTRFSGCIGIYPRYVRVWFTAGSTVLNNYHDHVIPWICHQEFQQKNGNDSTFQRGSLVPGTVEFINTFGGEAKQRLALYASDQRTGLLEGHLFPRARTTSNKACTVTLNSYWEARKRLAV
jgi:hypothetical protein